MTNKVLITGGNKGIGLETTKLFLNHGYEIFVVARDFNSFEYINEAKVHAIRFDVSKIKEIKNVIKEIGNVDILINNAGLMNSLPYNNYPVESQETLMAVNLYAPIEFINCVVPGMIQNNYGRIVNIASIAGQIGHPDIWYGISKAGLINATKSFAKILGSKCIVINAVAPGPVNTDMLNLIPEVRKEVMKSSTYLNRFAEANEIAKTVYWLATECPEYINGTCIDINNGIFPR
jgi:3-oxoacyl-[acyl-carrier protein] reductase